MQFSLPSLELLGSLGAHSELVSVPVSGCPVLVHTHVPSLAMSVHPAQNDGGLLLV